MLFPAAHSKTWTTSSRSARPTTREGFRLFKRRTGGHGGCARFGHSLDGTQLQSPPNFNLDYDYFAGTSMASPLVTGLVALMWSRHPSFTYKVIRDCLIRSAVKLGPGGFDNRGGTDGLRRRKPCVTRRNT